MQQQQDDGTTSACAENTPGTPHVNRPLRNYLRVRGEYQADANRDNPRGELPPRARRIPLETISEISAEGTTSACAENTRLPFRPGGGAGNYLRVRGEYLCFFPSWPYGTELPPRARRIRILIHNRKAIEGTTSACAENTRTGSLRRSCTRNYLRVRGEYS